MKQTVIINSDKSIGYLDEHIGRVLVGYQKYDIGEAHEPDPEAYVLEFSDAPIECPLTPEELNTLLECSIKAANGEGLEAYREFHMMLTDRFYRNGYGNNGGLKRPERPQIEMRREDGLL